MRITRPGPMNRKEFITSHHGLTEHRMAPGTIPNTLEVQFTLHMISLKQDPLEKLQHKTLFSVLGRHKASLSVGAARTHPLQAHSKNHLGCFSGKTSHLALPRKAWLGQVPHPQGRAVHSPALLQDSNTPVPPKPQNLPQSTAGMCFPVGLTLWLWSCGSQAPVSKEPVQELIREQIGMTLFGKLSWPLVQKKQQMCSPGPLRSCSRVVGGRRILPLSVCWGQSPWRGDTAQ